MTSDFNFIYKDICTQPGEEYRSCGNPCEATCASLQSPKCYEKCASGCFCKKGFVRDPEFSVRPKCIKTSECPKSKLKI